MVERTPEQIYTAAMDSVHLINGARPEFMTDAEWADCIARNKAHLRIVLAYDIWTDENLSPLQTAAA